MNITGADVPSSCELTTRWQIEEPKVKSSSWGQTIGNYLQSFSGKIVLAWVRKLSMTQMPNYVCTIFRIMFECTNIDFPLPKSCWLYISSGPAESLIFFCIRNPNCSLRAQIQQTCQNWVRSSANKFPCYYPHLANKKRWILKSEDQLAHKEKFLWFSTFFSR